MDILESFRVALEGLIANKLRSALTMLGVIIGVSAVILLVSIGQGAKNYITGEIEGLGSNLIFVIPGKIGFGRQQGPPSGITNKLTLRDARAIAREAVTIKGVSPIVNAYTAIKYLNEKRLVNLYGVSSAHPKVFNVSVIKGNFFNEAQVNARRSVCTIGQTVVDDFFGNVNPIGKRVTIGTQKFTIIGTLKKRGQALGVDSDNVTHIPITTAQVMFGTDKVSSILISAKDPGKIEQTVDEVTKILKKRLDEDDFSVESQAEVLETMQSILGILTLMLAGIASISLLVGGIGIMNIMLVSVTERTREIGIRKAVGAKTRDVLLQFIIEAVTLSVIGGAIGIALGASGARLINKFLPTQTTIWSVLIAFGFSAAVGIFFGVYPAYKASRLDPIVALRYE